MPHTPQDIHQRIYNFVISVIKLIRGLTHTPENNVIRYQIAKSVTSMGANDNEADGAITSKDFCNKYSIVRKEGKETLFWLSVIKDTNPILAIKAGVLKDECLEIIKIVTTIIYNTKKKNSK